MLLTFQLIGVTATVDLQLLLEKRVVCMLLLTSPNRLFSYPAAAAAAGGGNVDLENECAIHTPTWNTVRGSCDDLHGKVVSASLSSPREP